MIRLLRTPEKSSMRDEIENCVDDRRKGAYVFFVKPFCRTNEQKETKRRGAHFERKINGE